MGIHRKWLVLLAVSMSTFLSTIDGSIVNVTLPTLVRELHSTFAVAQWVILAYLLTQTVLVISVGRLSDMIGKKKLYVSGIVIFTTGSLLCGLAPSIGWLIGFRFLQAIGAAMALALGMAIVTEVFPAAERGRALGFNGTVVSVGIVIGPTLGGFILDAASWRWIFFVNLPVGFLGFLLAMRFLPQTRPPGRQHFDLRGAVSLGGSLLALLLALTSGQQVGFAASRTLLFFVLFLLFLGTFLYVERRTVQPLIDLQLMGNPLFSSGLLMGMLAFIAIAGTTLLLPFYLDTMRGFPPRQVGLMMAIIPIFLGVVAPLAGGLSDRLGTRPVTTAGLSVALASFLLMSRLSLTTSLVAYALPVSLLGLGMGIFQSPNNSAVMGAAPRERLGIASGLLGTSRTLGQTAGISILGTLWATRATAYAGGLLEGGATQAPLEAQIAALQDVFIIMAVLEGAALLLSVWSLRRSTAPARA